MFVGRRGRERCSGLSSGMFRFWFLVRVNAGSCTNGDGVKQASVPRDDYSCGAPRVAHEKRFDWKTGAEYRCAGLSSDNYSLFALLGEVRTKATGRSCSPVALASRHSLALALFGSFDNRHGMM